MIELGLSYDSSFVNLCGGDSLALEKLQELMIEVNSLFDEAPPLQNADIFVFPRQIREVNGFNKYSNFTYNSGIAGYWTHSRTGNDLCYIPDIAHHITGDETNLGHAQLGGTCKLYPKSDTGGASHTAFTNLEAIRQQAFAVVHELLHQIGLGHDDCSNVPTNKHCLMDGTSGGTTFHETHSYSSLWMSNNYINNLTDLLNGDDLNCLDSSEQQISVEPDPNCQSCDGQVILTANNTDYLNYLNFSCIDTLPADSLLIPLLTVFKNSCNNRVVQVEVYYNHNHLDSLILPAGFNAPDTLITNDFTRIIKSPNLTLNKGSAHASKYLFYLNGQTKYNILAGQNGTAIRVKYKYVSGDPFINLPPDATYRFLFPYVIDKRGLSVVYADAIRTPVQDQPYNFCSGIRHDIYIDAELIINYDASYCNAHFIMGENAKITIAQGKIVKFDNCTFRTCNPSVKWLGMELANGADVSISGNSKIYNTYTAIKGIDNANIKISGTNAINKRVEFHNCTVGIEAKNGGNLDVSNCLFNKPYIAIDILNQGAIIASTEFASPSGGFGIRVVQDPGITYTVSVSNTCKFKKHLRGIFARNTRLSITKTTFDDNYMPILITDAPNTSHVIQNSVYFNNTKFDGLTVSNSTSLSSIPSILNSGHFFTGRQNGIRLYNSKNGWNIQFSTFNNNRTGIYILNSNKINVTNSQFNFNLSDRAFASNMNFIRMSSSENNLIGRNSASTNNFTISSVAQPNDIYRHIFLDNSGMNNRILCNEFTGGNRGINPWAQSQTVIAGNEFKYIDRGLYYGLQQGDNVTSTGRQEFNNNRWTLSDPDNDIGATHLGATLELVGQSKYLTHDDAKPYLPTFEAVDGQWFFKPLNPQTPHNCGTGFTGGGGNGIFQMVTPNNTFNNFPFATAMTAASQNFIYEEIVSGETFGESSGSITLYLDTLESNTDLFHVKEAEKLIYAPGTNQAAIETRFAALQEALNEYYAMDSLSTEVKDSMKAVISQLESAANYMYNTYRIELDSNLILAQGHLTQVSNTQPYWYNKARVLEVLVKKWQGQDPDSAEMVMLEEIANQCPLEGGKGVYMARGILAEYSLEETLYDDLTKCTPVTPRAESAKEHFISIYPNPGKDKFNISSPSPISHLFITDYTGRVMLSKECNHTMVEVLTEGWPAGIYLVKVKTENRDNSVVKKIIIIP
ncbi:MAG: T9SS type A sorting domain-containing protein [Saprospiraceae bacterium]|nr:T9SS type A sorting domain-containing protein [Saprospiraceae bacterium]